MGEGGRGRECVCVCFLPLFRFVTSVGGEKGLVLSVCIDVIKKNDEDSNDDTTTTFFNKLFFTHMRCA